MIYQTPLNPTHTLICADDTKIFRIIKGEDDKEILQDDLTKLEEWSDKWLLKFHPEKCKHMKISNSKNEETNTYKLLGQDIETVTQEKDIGVIIDSELTFENHLCEKVKKIYFHICSNEEDFQVFRYKVILGDIQNSSQNSFRLCQLCLGTIQDEAHRKDK